MNTIIKAFAAILIMSTLSSCGYNSMVTKNEEIEGKWANVQSQYQRRADLIPNLVEVVKQYADFEQETLTKVVEARAKATSININANDLSPENLAKFQEAQSQLSGSLSRLLLTVEKYPDLKANRSFENLSAELAGTENRIGFARDEFNTAVKDYNAYIKKFPQLIVSKITGFDERGYFEADAGADKAPNAKDLFKD